MVTACQGALPGRSSSNLMRRPGIASAAAGLSRKTWKVSCSRGSSSWYVVSPGSAGPGLPSGALIMPPGATIHTKSVFAKCLQSRSNHAGTPRRICRYDGCASPADGRDPVSVIAYKRSLGVVLGSCCVRPVREAEGNRFAEEETREIACRDSRLETWVHALLPTGNKPGTYVVCVAVRATGNFTIQRGRDVVQGIAHRH
jgi:hypothetical protein